MRSKDEDSVATQTLTRQRINQDKQGPLIIWIDTETDGIEDAHVLELYAEVTDCYGNAITHLRSNANREECLLETFYSLVFDDSYFTESGNFDDDYYLRYHGLAELQLTNPERAENIRDALRINGVLERFALASDFHNKDICWQSPAEEIDLLLTLAGRPLVGKTRTLPVNTSKGTRLAFNEWLSKWASYGKSINRNVIIGGWAVNYDLYAMRNSGILPDRSVFCSRAANKPSTVYASAVIDVCALNVWYNFLTTGSGKHVPLNQAAEDTGFKQSDVSITQYNSPFVVNYPVETYFKSVVLTESTKEKVLPLFTKHSAVFDVKATIEVYRKLNGALGVGWLK